MSSNLDLRLMRRAVDLARMGEGSVEPNPMVGCVIAQGDKIVGEGWHQRYGGPHAEVNALQAAGPAANGAVAYVTLEPCCHTGKTPPCTHALLDAGVARVVMALRDPNPRVNGGGLLQLQQAGVDCEVGIGEQQAKAVLAPYLKLHATARPWVIAKWAMTLDGKLATATGSSQWISSPESRQIVHRLRGRVDAIIVGSGTARADDPLLTARPPGLRTPARIVLGEVSAESQLAKTTDQAPVISVHADSGLQSPPGIERLLVDGPTDTDRLALLLDELGRRGMTNVLIEGGAKVLGAAFDGRLIDEVHTFIAPRLAGGAQAPSPIGGTGVADMQDAIELVNAEMTPSGPDVYLRGRTKAPREIGQAQN